MQRWMLGLLGAVVVWAGCCPTAFAGANYALDETLSLTGDCSTSKSDLVPDPGCPGGDHPPSGFFSAPTSVATDDHGNIYVANWGLETAEGAAGRIDIFSPSGIFITEIQDPAGPKSLALDTVGNLYVFDYRPGQGGKVVRYSPSVYVPERGEVEYSNAPVVVTEVPWFFAGLAVDRVSGHLYVHRQSRIEEYGAASEGNILLDEAIGNGAVSGTAQGLAVDSKRGRIYASAENVVKVLALEAPHAVLQTIDGSTAPPGKFANRLSLAVDEETGHLFVYDGEGTNDVYELTENGEYVSTIDHSFQYVYGAKIAIDNGSASPNRGYLFVPSHPDGVGHVFAFGPPPPVFKPQIESISFTGVTESEAVMNAVVNPGNLRTNYSIEVTSLERFEIQGFDGAILASKGQIPAGGTGVATSASIGNLLPGNTYRFRVVATNETGVAAAEGQFTTYGAGGRQPCPNDELRAGLSFPLPDCRAYELVTPADTNARTPLGAGGTGVYFASTQASPTGNQLSFMVDGGSLPGTEATGSYAGDQYLAVRTGEGWRTARAGPTGAESSGPLPGSTSVDQGYSFWEATGDGTAVFDGPTDWVRYPDGNSQLVGRGTLGVDPHASGKYISDSGGHIIFVSGGNVGYPSLQLEPDAPPSGTKTIYDRTADGVTHVVSLLPGDVTLADGEDASYVGVSPDGKGVAFSIDSTLYLRYDNQDTFEIGENVTFAGIAEGGSRIFYVEGGKLLRFDALTREIKPFNASGTIVPVNVSADGSAAYFISTSVLTSKANPNGTKAKSGQQNLYLSEEGTISFVGTVTERDVVGNSGGNEIVGGLGLWTAAVGPGTAERPGRLAADPSRSTPDGDVLLFEARARLAAYDSEGQTQVYRYDSAKGLLECLSCNPTGAPPVGEASLQSVAIERGTPEPFGSYSVVANIRPDGRRAFFQSEDPLVPADFDGLQDVYEWEDQGVGSCTKPTGCVYLISSGNSESADYLFGVSGTGDDVFFRSADLLLPADTDETPSIYDARVDGGFAEATGVVCQGEGCRGAMAEPPAFSTPASRSSSPLKKCPKGKRKTKRHGRRVCVKKHRPRHHKHRSRHKGARK